MHGKLYVPALKVWWSVSYSVLSTHPRDNSLTSCLRLKRGMLVDMTDGLANNVEFQSLKSRTCLNDRGELQFSVCLSDQKWMDAYPESLRFPWISLCQETLLGKAYSTRVSLFEWIFFQVILRKYVELQKQRGRTFLLSTAAKMNSEQC